MGGRRGAGRARHLPPGALTPPRGPPTPLTAPPGLMGFVVDRSVLHSPPPIPSSFFWLFAPPTRVAQPITVASDPAGMVANGSPRWHSAHTPPPPLPSNPRIPPFLKLISQLTPPPPPLHGPAGPGHMAWKGRRRWVGTGLEGWGTPQISPHTPPEQRQAQAPGPVSFSACVSPGRASCFPAAAREQCEVGPPPPASASRRRHVPGSPHPAVPPDTLPRGHRRGVNPLVIIQP